jgi:hypothetical protein
MRSREKMPRPGLARGVNKRNNSGFKSAISAFSRLTDRPCYRSNRRGWCVTCARGSRAIRRIEARIAAREALG